MKNSHELTKTILKISSLFDHNKDFITKLIESDFEPSLLNDSETRVSEIEYDDNTDNKYINIMTTELKCDFKFNDVIDEYCIIEVLENGNLSKLNFFIMRIRNNKRESIWIHYDLNLKIKELKLKSKSIEFTFNPDGLDIKDIEKIIKIKYYIEKNKNIDSDDIIMFPEMVIPSVYDFNNKDIENRISLLEMIDL